jgi:Transposase IS66 family
LTTREAPSHQELSEARIFLETNSGILPESTANVLLRVLRIYASLLLSAGRAKNTLSRLREAMGISPKSERGGKLSESNQVQATFEPKDLSPAQKEALAVLQAKRDQAHREKLDYDKQIRALNPKPKGPTQLEFDLVSETLFSEPAALKENVNHKETVERIVEFGREKGLHSTYDTTKRMDLKIVVTETTHQVETVTDPETGVAVRASMSDIGPEGFQLTWLAIATLVKLHVAFAIPINRLAMLIGQPEFSSGKICRILHYVAQSLLPIYLCLIEMLSDVGILSGDDTKTKVLQLDQPGEDTLADAIDQMLGFAQAKKDGTGEKKGLNVSLLVGRSKKEDPRSTIRFFRTHLGSVGDLLSQALELRNPKAGPLIFQGDLSTSNLPSHDLMKQFDVIIAGCGAHARRPFWRYKEDDEALCYFMLRGFLMLSQIETRIDSRGRTETTILKLRGRYSKWVWQALKNRCIAATTGEIFGRATYRKNCGPQIWPPSTELHTACRYVIKHFEELTRYLSNAHLHYTNNGIERALRIEKCMLSGSKFRKTRNGRAVLDVLRTINATCTAAKIDLTVYLRYVFKHLPDVLENPKKYTPYAVALRLEQEKKSA